MLETGSLLGILGSHGLRPLVKLGLGLQSHDSASPLAHQVSILVKLLHSQILEDFELSLVLLVHSRERDDGGGLLVDEGAEAGLVLDNHEGDLHLAAQRREPEHELDGVDVARDEDEGRLLLLNEGGHVLQSEFELMGDVRGLALALGLGRGLLLVSLLLGGGGFRSVLVKELEDVHGLVLADGLRELVDGGGDLEPLVEDGALALDADVFGPSDESAEVAARGTDGAADIEGTGAGGEEGVRLRGGGGLDGGLALGLGGFLGCHC
mmetsp:Transcript_9378/g.22878  ORF Transcript_9378/g.22878 Transcript_9378/m.22878 type:complete len:266 (+) Transcript_9378:240-1037(+)